MPRKKGSTATTRKPAARKRAVMVIQDGKGFMDIFKGINNFLKKSKIISSLTPVLSAIPGVGEIAMPIGAAAGALGYGKKKRAAPKKKRGAGLNPGGGSLRLAGQKTVYR